MHAPLINSTDAYEQGSLQVVEDVTFTCLSVDVHFLCFFQGDCTANRPKKLLLILQAVGSTGGWTRTCPPVVWKLGHYGKAQPFNWFL